MGRTLTGQCNGRSDRRRGIGLVPGILTTVVLASLLIVRSREPVYQGKSAGAWVEELGDNSYGATGAIREIGPGAVPALVRALERRPAAWLKTYALIVNCSPGFLKPKLTGHYLDLARRESQIPRVRIAAAQVLGDLGPAARNAAPALVEALRDRDPTLRRNAAFALGKIGAKPALAVPALAGVLSDRNEEVRMYAAIALKKFGPQAARAVPGLVAALSDSNWQVRERAALALGATGNNQADVVLALEGALQDEHRYVRSSAATALASMAPHTRSARAALAQARYDPDAEVRYSANVAMRQMDPEAAAQAGVSSATSGGAEGLK
ncbi:MAG TPA: HEAT repeat domain-containing protein [Haliangiales bacterium]|nr:HEAT repeat domain-containing protein [Haliangiales bacterium]